MAAADHARHTFAWIAPDAAWRALGAASASEVGDWLARGKPVVVARRQGDEPAGWLRLGIALPPARGKRRLAFAAPATALARTREAVRLVDVTPSAPIAWRAPLRALADAARELGLDPRVYGSFAWQALTGDRYVGAGSDIDLSWPLAHAAQIPAVVATLREWEHRTGRRADGELAMPGGDAVCWREIAGGSARVLVKSAASVALRPTSELMAALA